MEIVHNPGVEVDPSEASIIKSYFAHAKKIIEKDLGKLIHVHFSHKTITFAGEKDAKKFHRKTFIDDLRSLNRSGMN